MAVNLVQTNNTGKISNKRLALKQIVKIDLNAETNSESCDEGQVFLPAYISTTNISQGIQFQLLGML